MTLAQVLAAAQTRPLPAGVSREQVRVWASGHDGHGHKVRPEVQAMALAALDEPDPDWDSPEDWDESDADDVNDYLGKDPWAAAIMRGESPGMPPADEDSTGGNVTLTPRTAEASTVHEPTVPPGGPGLFHMKGHQLPPYVQHLYKHLVARYGKHRAYGVAIGIVKKWAAGVHPGGKKGKKGGHHVHADVQAAAVKNVAEWEKEKAEAHAHHHDHGDHGHDGKDKSEQSGGLASVVALAGVKGYVREEKGHLEKVEPYQRHGGPAGHGTVVFDVDGTLTAARSPSISGDLPPLDVEGIKEAQRRGYNVAVVSAWALRPAIEQRLQEAGLKTERGYNGVRWDGGPDGKTVLLSGRKVSGVAYVDDRAVNHAYGDDWGHTLDQVDRVAEGWAPLPQRDVGNRRFGDDQFALSAAEQPVIYVYLAARKPVVSAPGAKPIGGTVIGAKPGLPKTTAGPQPVGPVPGSRLLYGQLVHVPSQTVSPSPPLPSDVQMPTPKELNALAELIEAQNPGSNVDGGLMSGARDHAHDAAAKMQDGEYVHALWSLRHAQAGVHSFGRMVARQAIPVANVFSASTPPAEQSSARGDMQALLRQRAQLRVLHNQVSQAIDRIRRHHFHGHYGTIAQQARFSSGLESVLALAQVEVRSYVKEGPRGLERVRQYGREHMPSWFHSLSPGDRAALRGHAQTVMNALRNPVDTARTVEGAASYLWSVRQALPKWMRIALGAGALSTFLLPGPADAGFDETIYAVVFGALLLHHRPLLAAVWNAAKMDIDNPLQADKEQKATALVEHVMKAGPIRRVEPEGPLARIMAFAAIELDDSLPGKMSKLDAGYRKAYNAQERCKNCLNDLYQEGDKEAFCAIVAGTIEPGDVCDYFGPKGIQAASGDAFLLALSAVKGYRRVEGGKVEVVRPYSNRRVKRGYQITGGRVLPAKMLTRPMSPESRKLMQRLAGQGKKYFAGEGFFNDALGHRHWGWYGAAGLLVHHTDETGVTRYLIQKRAGSVQSGGTWSIPGGALDWDKAHGAPEDAITGAQREAQEEFGTMPDDLKITKQDVDGHGVKGKPGYWSYTTVHAESPKMFMPKGKGASTSWESAGFRWATPQEMEELPLHPGFAPMAIKLGANITEAEAPVKLPWAQGMRVMHIDKKGGAHYGEITELGQSHGKGIPQHMVKFDDEQQPRKMWSDELTQLSKPGAGGGGDDDPFLQQTLAQMGVKSVSELPLGPINAHPQQLETPHMRAVKMAELRRRDPKEYARQLDMRLHPEKYQYKWQGGSGYGGGTYAQGDWGSFGSTSKGKEGTWAGAFKPGDEVKYTASDNNMHTGTIAKKTTTKGRYDITADDNFTDTGVHEDKIEHLDGSPKVVQSDFSGGGKAAGKAAFQPGDKVIYQHADWGTGKEVVTERKGTVIQRGQAPGMWHVQPEGTEGSDDWKQRQFVPETKMKLAEPRAAAKPGPMKINAGGQEGKLVQPKGYKIGDHIVWKDDNGYHGGQITAKHKTIAGKWLVKSHSSGKTYELDQQHFQGKVVPTAPNKNAPVMQAPKGVKNGTRVRVTAAGTSAIPIPEGDVDTGTVRSSIAGSSGVLHRVEMDDGRNVLALGPNMEALEDQAKPAKGRK